jgi:hypothetical protein
MVTRPRIQLVAGVESNKVRLSATGAVTVTMEEEKTPTGSAE